MKTLIVAFGLAILAIVAVFLALSIIGVDPTVSSSIAATIIGGVPYIRESLDKYITVRKHPEGLRVVPLGRFALKPQRLVLYGALMLFAAIQFSSFFGGIIAAILEVTPEKMPTAIKASAFLIVFPAAFLIGRWVGRRSEGNGLLSIFLIAVLSRIAASLLDWAALSHDELANFLNGQTDTEAISSALAMQIGGGIFIFVVLGALGYWRGRHQRLGSYLGYLLKNIPVSTRHAIVDLAFDEANRVERSKGAVYPPSSAVMTSVRVAASPLS